MKYPNYRRKIACLLLSGMIMLTSFSWPGEVRAAGSSSNGQTISGGPALIEAPDEEVELISDVNISANDPQAPGNDERDTDEYFMEADEPGDAGIAMEPGIGMDDPIGDWGISAAAAGGANGFCEVRTGVDVSYWQGTMNWATAKNAGVQFAFVRACYRGLQDGSISHDTQVYNNIDGASAQGIPVGLYCYSQAINEAEAIEEAQKLIAIADTRRTSVTLPLVMDYEYGSEHSGRLANARLNAAQATANIKAFCRTVEAAGYEAMIYASLSVLNSDMYASQLVSDGYDIWIARYTAQSKEIEYYEDIYQMMGDINGINAIYPGGDFEFWQCCSNGKGSTFGAQSSRIDLDYWFVGQNAFIDIDLEATQTIDGKSMNVIMDNTFWNEVAMLDGKYVKVTLTDTADTATTKNKHLHYDIPSTNCHQLKVFVSNLYPQNNFAFVYNLTYNPNTYEYAADLAYIENYFVSVPDADYPSDYTDKHYYIEGQRQEFYGPYPNATGAGAGATKMWMYKFEGDWTSRKLEKTTYKLTFDDTAHKYNVQLESVDDYSVVIEPPAGYSSESVAPTIWLDGKACETTVTKDGKWKTHLGSIYTDAEAAAMPEVATIYSYKASGAPLGMSVYLLSYDDGYKVEKIDTFTDALIYGGYSMRVSGRNGMRYRAGINNTFKTNLRATGVNGYKLQELGIVAITEKNYASHPIVIGEDKTSTSKTFYYESSTKIKDTILQNDTATGICYFSAFFEDMPVRAYQMPMVTRSYMKVQKDGKVYTIYSAPYSKAMYVLAGQVLRAGEFAREPEKEDYLRKIISDADEYAAANPATSEASN